jgi:hypothetical protein
MSRDALIVGINQYQALSGLNAPAADAEAVATRLQTQGDFRVHRLPEVIQKGIPAVGSRSKVTTQMLEDALVQLFKPKGKNIPTTALFYFSGHGLQREAGIQEGYLATSDTDPSTGNFGIPLNWLRRLLQQSPVRQIIVILDCCHSGELLSFSEADPGASAGTDRLFMAASREFESAYEEIAGQHSVFTKALLSGLDPRRQDGGKVNSYNLTEHISQQLRGEIQQPLFESSGSEIVLTRVSGIQPAIISKTPLSMLARIKKLTFGFCPYRGLSPFDEAHADYFFGREKLTEELLQAVSGNNFCALIGASSSGKTSLLRAGLMHHLRKGSHIEGSQDWVLKSITPTQHPIKSLAAAFSSATTDQVERAGQMHQAEKFLRESGGNGLADLVRAHLLKPGQTSVPATSKLWLIIDQFEELLTTTLDADILQERQLFIQCLTQALNDPSTPIGVVIGLRADAVDNLLPYPEFKAFVDNHNVVVTPMSYEQIRAVIAKPAQKMDIEIDPRLIHFLTLDTTGAPSELPLIQQTLLELWRRRDSGERGNAQPKLTLEAYTDIGSIRNVLKHRATAVYDNLDDEMKRAARRIFLGLCELGEGREDERRRAFRTELINEKFPPELIDRTLDKLATERLIVVSQAAISSHCCCPEKEEGIEMPTAVWQTQTDEASPLTTWFLNNVQNKTQPILGSPVTIDIIHKSLVNDWDLLRSWLTESRNLLRLQRKLEGSAREWDQRNRPKGIEYLLGGTQLQETLAFLQLHRDELSDVAQEYIAASQKAHRRLRWRTSMIIPLALAAGMSAHLVGRLLFPAISPPSVPVELSQPSNQSKTGATVNEQSAPAKTSTDNTPSSSSTSPWQKQSKGQSQGQSQGQETSSISPVSANASANASANVTSRAAAPGNGDYVMVPAGKMPSPSNPEEMVEVWWMKPQGAAAQVLPSAAVVQQPSSSVGAPE